MWLLYQTAVGLALAFAGPFLLVRRGSHYLSTVVPRLGIDPRAGDAGRLWIHAVSVGEATVAATLARRLGDERLLVTTVTPTGQERARGLLGDGAEVAYLPYELGFAVRRFLRRWRPRALVLVEGDLWPLVLRAAERRGLPVCVVNGRVSDRSFTRMRRLRPLLGPLLDRVERFGVQTADDAARLAELGVPDGRIEVTGNLKFESPEPPRQPELEAGLDRLAAGRPVWIAGSTMEGEEQLVAEAFERAGGGGAALLVLAPRHPERWDRVADLLADRGLAVARRSHGPALAAEDPPDVLLLDSLGELAGAYRQADGAFVGGTLVATGGHNPLEAARFGVPVAVGPSMENFREIADAFDGADAWARVPDARALAAAWRSWLDRPDAAAALGERGRELVRAHRGALERTLGLLAEVVPGVEAAAASGEGRRGEAGAEGEAAEGGSKGAPAKDHGVRTGGAAG